jgi:hypothetical protein
MNKLDKETKELIEKYKKIFGQVRIVKVCREVRNEYQKRF